MSETPNNSTHTRVPWPGIGAALTAFSALYISSDGYNGLIVLGVLLVLTLVIRWRIPDRIVLLWLIRAVAFAIVIATAPYGRSFNISVFYEPAYVNRFGFMCAAELVLRAWTNRAKGPWLAEIVFLSALVIAAASNTFEHRQVFKIVAPIYAAFLIIMLRRLGRPPIDRPRFKPGLMSMRVVAAIVAISIGFTGIWFIEKYDNPITYWAVHLLNQRIERSTKSEIGLTTSPDVSAAFNPKPSTERVLRVRGDVSERHLRAMAFDTCNSNLWRPLIQERDFTPPAAGQEERGQPSSDDITLRIDRLSDTLGLTIVPAETKRLEIDGGYEIDSLGTLRDAGDDADRYRAVVARGQFAEGIPATPMSDAARKTSLVVPTSTDPEVIEISKQVAGEGTPIERVLRISNYLRSTCKYSLSAAPMPGDGVSNFVLKTKAGHCVMFGSAVVVMSRAAGVPARFVTGYYAHERSGSNELTVRQRDAHAWAECWIDGVGWITVDATPASGLPDQLFPEPSKWKKLWEDVMDIPSRIKQWFNDLTQSQFVLLIAVATVVIALVWAWQNRHALRRRKKRADASLAIDPEFAELARRFEQALVKQKVVVSPTRTWREHVTKLPEPHVARAAQFIREYEAARFGPVRVKPDRRLHAMLDEMETLELKRPQASIASTRSKHTPHPNPLPQGERGPEEHTRADAQLANDPPDAEPLPPSPLEGEGGGEGDRET